MKKAAVVTSLRNNSGIPQDITTLHKKASQNKEPVNGSI
jgi:hypothetical protein